MIRSIEPRIWLEPVFAEAKAQICIFHLDTLVKKMLVGVSHQAPLQQLNRLYEAQSPASPYIDLEI